MNAQCCVCVCMIYVANITRKSCALGLNDIGMISQVRGIGPTCWFPYTTAFSIALATFSHNLGWKAVSEDMETDAGCKDDHKPRALELQDDGVKLIAIGVRYSTAEC